MGEKIFTRTSQLSFDQGKRRNRRCASLFQGLLGSGCRRLLAGKVAAAVVAAVVAGGGA